MSGDVLVENVTAELDSLDDGRHHLWCATCYPDAAASPLGIGLGNPFVAVCGVRAVILVLHLSDETPPAACQSCVTAPTCAEGGHR